MVNYQTNQEVIPLPYKTDEIVYHVVTDELSMGRYFWLGDATHNARKNPHYVVIATSPKGRHFIDHNSIEKTRAWADLAVKIEKEIKQV